MTALYDDLTLPHVGSTTAHDVLSRALARLPGDLLAISPRGLDASAARKALAAVHCHLRQAAKSPDGPYAGAVFAALRRPTVGAHARCLRDIARSGQRSPIIDAETHSFGLTLTFELAFAGVLDRTFCFRGSSPVLCLGARRVVKLPDDFYGVEISPRGVTLLRDVGVTEHSLDELAPTGTSGPWHPVVEPMVLALADNNPHVFSDMLSNDPAVAINTGSASVDTWTHALRACLTLTEAYLPEIRREMDLHVQIFVPTGVHPEVHRSVSFPRTLGTVYLSLHPSLMTMTEAVIHEAQHNKLHAMMELDPLVTNEPTERYHSPWRPDLRPMRGLLLAVHAFIPVEQLYARMAAAGHPLSQRPSFRARHAQIRAINRKAAETLYANAKTTPQGAALLDEFRLLLSEPS